MQRNFMEIFYGPEDTQWGKAAPGGASRGAQPTRACQEAQARPGGLCPPRAPPGDSPAHWMSSGPKKSTKSFVVFGLRSVLISYDKKTCRKQQLALGTMSIG